MNQGIEDISQLELSVQLVLIFPIFFNCSGVSKAQLSLFKLLIVIVQHKQQQSTINDDHHLNRAEGVCVIPEIPPVLFPSYSINSVERSSST